MAESQTYRHLQNPVSKSVLLMVANPEIRFECCQLLTQLGLRLGLIYPHSQQDQALKAVAIAAQGGAIVLPMSFEENSPQQFSELANRMKQDFGRLDTLILGIDAESKRIYGDIAKMTDAIRPHLEKPRPRGRIILLADSQENPDEESLQMCQNNFGTGAVQCVPWNGPDTDFGLWEVSHD